MALTEKEFLQQIMVICDEHPLLNNPSDGKYCYYSYNPKTERFPNNAHKHDLIGEWLTRNNFEVPTDEIINAEVLFTRLGLPHLAQIAQMVQSLSDLGVSYGAKPPLWRMVKKNIESMLKPELLRR